MQYIKKNKEKWNQYCKVVVAKAHSALLKILETDAENYSFTEIEKELAEAKKVYFTQAKGPSTFSVYEEFWKNVLETKIHCFEKEEMEKMKLIEIMKIHNEKLTANFQSLKSQKCHLKEKEKQERELILETQKSILKEMQNEFIERSKKELEAHKRLLVQEPNAFEGVTNVLKGVAGVVGTISQAQSCIIS